MEEKKARIDNFIGIIPQLNKVNESPKYSKYNNLTQNNAYWQGFYDAKMELRNKLYEKENIPLKSEEELIKPDEYSPDFNITLFGKKLYE